MQIDQAMGRLFTALATQRIIAPDQAMRALFFDDPDRARRPVAFNFVRAAPVNSATMPGMLSAAVEQTVLDGGVVFATAFIALSRALWAHKGADRWLRGYGVAALPMR